jgi:ABC-type branched-subunit amino acid transport system substrate-binding protein
MALDDASAEGEVPVVIDGRPLDIQPVWIDSQSDPDAGSVAVAGALARDNIGMMLGGWHTAVALRVMDIEAAQGILHLGGAQAAQTIADKINQDPVKYRGWFKGWPSPAKLIPQYSEPLQHFLQQGL